MKEIRSSRKAMRLSALCAIVGAVVSFVAPDSWWNSSYMPSYVSWFTVPSSILFVIICVIFRYDFISDGGNATALSIISVISNAILAAIYGAIVFYLHLGIKQALSKK